MKQIKIEQINAILQTIYQTNISAQNFDAIKKLFTELTDVKEDKKVVVDLEKLDKEIKDEENR
jgi:anti-anti-sigma regulatory factor